MPISERLSAYMPLMNEGAVRIMPSEYTDWLEPQSVDIPGDPTIPEAPGLSASAADESIDLVLVPPQTNTDGTACYDFKEFQVFYAYSAGIDPDDPETYAGSFWTSATRHTFPTESTCYFRAVAWDRYGNRSAPSPEVYATPDTAELAPFVDDYTQNIAQVYVGKGMIAVEFQPPKSTWVRWTGWRLYYDVNQGSGWSGTWTLIYSGQEPGFLHKNLNENWKYKYRLTVTAEGGMETNGTVADNGGQGYQPNASDNSAILARTLFAERIIATTEMLSRTFKGGILQSLNWGTNAGTEFNLDTGTFRLGGSSSPKLSWDGTNLSVVGNITVTGGSVPYSYVTGGPPANADNTATVISSGLITTGRIELGSGSTVKAGIDGAGTSDSDVRIWAGATYTNRSSAPFRVTQGGVLYATGAVISGTITVTGGSVPYSYVTGGPPANADNTATVISSGLITTGRIELGSGSYIKAGIDGAGTSDSDIRIWAGATYANRASAPFRVTQGGALYATSATIGGTFSGSFSGSANISSGSLGNYVAIDSSGINVGTYGSIRGGKSDYGSGTGFFLGYSGGTYKFDIGSSSQYVRWDGSTLYVKGRIVTDSGSSIHGSYLADGSVTDAKIANISADKITAGTITASYYRSGTGFPRVEIHGYQAHEIWILRNSTYWGLSLTANSIILYRDNGAYQFAASVSSDFVTINSSSISLLGTLNISGTVKMPGASGTWEWNGPRYTGGFFVPSFGIYIYYDGSRYAIPVYGPV